MVEFYYIWPNNFKATRVVKKHDHPNWELIYYIKAKGVSNYYNGDEKTPLYFDNNTFILFPPNSFHDEIPQTKTNLVSIGFFVDGDIEQALRNISCNVLTDKNFSLQKIIEKLETEFYQKQFCYEDMLNSITNELLIYLTRQHQQLTSSHPFNYIARYFEQYYMTNINIDDFAKIHGFSPSYFRVLFKNKFGVSPKQYILNVRLKNIKRLLLDTDIPLTQIAENTGFTDYYQFSSFVKKHTGVSPKQLKNSNQ